MPTLNLFLSVAITVEAVSQNNSKSRIFLWEISVVDFRYSKTTAIHRNPTYDSETYDIGKLYFDSLKLFLSLDCSFFSI